MDGCGRTASGTAVESNAGAVAEQLQGSTPIAEIVPRVRPIVDVPGRAFAVPCCCPLKIDQKTRVLLAEN